LTINISTHIVARHAYGW